MRQCATCNHAQYMEGSLSCLYWSKKASEGAASEEQQGWPEKISFSFAAISIAYMAIVPLDGTCENHTGPTVCNSTLGAC